jgi:DNA-binding NarL/FixJ family response regulator
VILILEDDALRIGRFRTVLANSAPNAELRIWTSARAMIREVAAFLPAAILISLDHDLYPLPGETEDPGDGLEVAKFLAQRKPACPILIHSSNGDRRRMMAGEFELEGIEAQIVAPIGEDWIEAYWLEVVKTLLGPGGNSRA